MEHEPKDVFQDMTSKIIVEHREIEKLQDSLTIGTPSKGGELKIYTDFSDGALTRLKIDAAFVARAYAQAKMEKPE